MTPRIVLAGLVVALSLNGAAFAQTSPAGALAAEGEGRWVDALRLYQHALERDPSRADLWSRVADIEARLGRPAEAIRALEYATKGAPDDAPLQFKLAQAYGAANNPTAAAAALDRALAQQPANVDYLRARGAVAVWLGDYKAAERFYDAARAVQRDPDSTLQLGRVNAWTGDTDHAVKHYREYLKTHADDGAVWLDLANAEAWRGNSARAMDALHNYKDRFGETEEYSATLARALTAGGRPARALEVLDPLYRQDSKNFDLNVTRTLALAMRRRVPDARASLGSLQQIDPDHRQTRSTARVVRAAIGSSVEPAAGYYSDSDDLEITRITPASVFVMLPSATQIAGGYDRQILRAPRENGLGRANGESATNDTVWGGLSQVFGPLTVFGRIGRASELSFDKTPYTVVASLRASDILTATIERTDDFFVVSPRTMELGLTQVRHHVNVGWSPTMESYLGFWATTQEISDHNIRWEFGFEPRYGFVRSEHLNLDVGFAAYRLGTRYDLPNGYYDPHRYESYSAVAYPYFKLGEDTGIGFSVAIGPQREGSGAWEAGETYSAQATFGIYRAWLLRVGGSATNNRRLESGAFHGYNGTVVLVRRF